MTRCLELPQAASSVLQQAATWRLLSLLFECPTADWHEQIAMLARETADRELVSIAYAARQEATAELYHSTFGPGGPAAPREVSYRRGVLPGVALAELCALYKAFAYCHPTDEPPDHVAVEAGFVAYLRFKQAYALTGGDRPHAELCDAAAGHFLREHVSHIAGRLADSLTCSGITYLAQAGETLRRLVGPSPADISLPVLEEADHHDD